MEHLGALQEVGWSSFDAGMPVEESEIMAQMFGPCSFARGDDHDDVLAMPSKFWMEDYANFYICSYSSDSGAYQWPQVCTSDSTSTLFSIPSEGESYCLSELNAIPVISTSLSDDFCCDAEQTTRSASHIVPSYLNEEASCEGLGGSLLKRKLDIVEDDRPLSLKIVEIPSENPKKKNQASGKTQKSANTVRSKKTRKKIETGNEEESIAALNWKSTSFCSSEDDSNAFQELNERGGKTRADHGSATDPQSLYARKRRERINERLKILQNLVPNGTKVDISTMLEEAVQYVKFLQLQIKLLSSDDTWMYAPIAYNGMDISINLNISPK